MIVFIHHSVNPYRVAFFNKLANSTDIPFKVYFLSKPAKNRKWKVEDFKPDFDYQFLLGWKFYVPGNDHSYFQINWGVWKQLNKDNPDMIITIGWNYLAAFIGFLFARFKNKKFVVWSGSTKYEKSYFRTLTLPLVKLLVRFTDRFIAYGTRAKKYLIYLGADSKKINIAYNTIDTRQMMKRVEKLKSKKYDIRKEYGWDKDTKVALYVGQLIKRKGVDLLMQLVKEFRNKENLKFVLVGYGPLEESIKEFVDKNRLDNLKLAGFVKNEDIMKYYVSSDIFLLLSREETWGLVVNEAMCAALPIIVSTYTGVSEDLVENGVNGFVVQPENTSHIKEKIEVILDDSSLLRKFGARSREIIETINLEQNVKVIEKIFKESNR